MAAVFTAAPERRRAFELSSRRRKETTSTLARRYGLSRTTVTRWRRRTTTADAPMGPSAPHGTVLGPQEEAMVVDRRRTLLPLDDVPGCLRDTIPTPTRSSLHRCLERHGVALPIPARPTPELQATPQDQNGTTLPGNCRVTWISYAGDEGGIVCKLKGTSESAEAAVASMPHSRFDPRLPVAREIVTYQKRRVKHLRRQQP